MSKLLELLDVIRTDSRIISATLVIWSIVLGIIIALCISFYNRKIVGSFFRALVTSGAVDEDTAKNLADISQTENDTAIKKLTKAQYKDLVTIIHSNPEQKIDENTKFYIEESKYTRVRDQWGETSESVGVLVGGIIGMIVLGILITIIAATSISI